MEINYLDHKVIHSLVPDSIYYIPDYITTDEERSLIDKVCRQPKPKWTHLSNRSLQVYGGYPRPEGMIPEPLPEWLKKFTSRLDRMMVFHGQQANQVLLNRYEPGQGIMAHEDGPLYFPTVATLNTGSYSVLNFYEKIADHKTQENINIQRIYRFSMLLWPRSLSIVKHCAYENYLHEIEELTTDEISNSHELSNGNRLIVNLNMVPEVQKQLINQKSIQLTRKTRYSFTVRLVPKCHKFNLNKLFNNKS